MKTILFQGDSITDCGRDRKAAEGEFSFKSLFNKEAVFGNGYPLMVKKALEQEKNGAYTYYNRGVSGDRVLDVYARIVRDIIKIKPDVMSLLVGVNDVWHGLFDNNGTGAERYEKVYNIIIEELKEELPNLKIMILEPFLLPGTATDKEGCYNTFRKEVEQMAAIAKRIAEKHGLRFIELQNKLDKAAEKHSPKEILRDGVHPTEKGHEIITEEWLKAFIELEV